MAHRKLPLSRRRAPARVLWLLALSLFGAGCAEDLEADATASVTEAIVTEAGAADTFLTRVNASDSAAWRYFSFATGSEVTPADPASSPDWDLAFQRFHILSNGGVSGSAGAAVAVISGATLESVTSPPADGFIEDQPDGDDDDTVAQSAFSMGDGWYAYDSATFRLSPHPNVYVVRTGSGAFFKLAIRDYYDPAGTSGYPSFEWSSL